MSGKLFVGADVSKEWIDFARVGDGGRRPPVCRIVNTEDAIRRWLDRQPRASIELVCFEPTGGYERGLGRCLRAAGLAFTRVHPNRLAAFRELRGVLAKTDAEDARLLAEFAASDLARRGLAPVVECDETLRALVLRRRQLRDMIQAETCRLAQCEDGLARALFEPVREALRSGFKAAGGAIAAHIAGSPELSALARRLRTLKGVGPITASTLMAELPELGRLSRREIAALVGLAPVQRDSGKRQGKAKTGFGRPGVRQVLFNAARAALRWNPVMRAFHRRLVEQNHRPGKVALLAVMRKMLVTLNAMARDGTDWNGASAA